MERILLVDDDEDMMMLTSRWLSKEGYDVTMKTSGKAALSFLDENEVDLVILDYAMPEMDGPDVLKAIRERGNMVNVIFRTGKDESDIEDIASKYSLSGSVSKAEGKKKLLEVVGNLL